LSLTLSFSFLLVIVRVPPVPATSGANVALICPEVNGRSASRTAFFVVRPEMDPVNGAVKLWSIFIVPVAPDMNVTFSESAAPNSRLALLAKLNEPVPVTAVLMMAFAVFAIVNLSDPVIAPLNVAFNTALDVNRT
jgi:hypothetical protein